MQNRLPSTFILFLIVICLTVGVFIVLKTQGNPYIKAQDDLSDIYVCDEVIPIGNTFEDTARLIKDLKTYQEEAQNYVNLALTNITQQIQEMTVEEDADAVCDFSKCRPETMDRGGTIGFNVDYIFGAFGIGADLAACGTTPCVGDPCPNFKRFLKGTKEDKGFGLENILENFKKTEEGVSGLLRKETEPIGWDLVRVGANEKPETKDSRVGIIRREIQLSRNWLTPSAEFTRMSCAMTKTARDEAESGSGGLWGPEKCLEMADAQAFWPRRWSEKCQKECSDTSNFTKDCRECLGSWSRWGKLDASLSEKNLKEQGSYLAKVNYIIYGACKDKCKKSLFDEGCVDCLCKKGLGKDDYTDEQCSAWLCGGSTANWVCCRETGIKPSDLSRQDFQIITIDGTSRLTFREAYVMAKSVASNQKIKNIGDIGPDLLLGVLYQETNLGVNRGGCVESTVTWRTHSSGVTEDVIFEKIVSQLKATTPPKIDMDIKDIRVSCSAAGQSGGAMGPFQFMPFTWWGANKDKESPFEYKYKLEKLFPERTPANPWDINDAFLAAAIKLATDKTRTGNDEGAINAYNPDDTYVRQVSCHQKYIKDWIDKGCFESSIATKDDCKIDFECVLRKECYKDIKYKNANCKLK